MYVYKMMIWNKKFWEEKRGRGRKYSRKVYESEKSWEK
jgi:hypothetical protein